MTNLKSIIAHIPHAPGVYRFLNDEGVVLYVGKAIDLRKRVSSYFRKVKGRSKRTEKLVEQVMDIECTVVDSELEALILETNLIKSFRPKYNILLKDDKSYVYLKVTVNEEYPRVMIARRLQRDGAKYFGPKTSAGSLRKILEALRKVFPYRHCPLFMQFNEKPAPKNMEDHLKRCLGTCSRSVSSEEYRVAIDQVVQFFEGKTEAIESSIKGEMEAAVMDKDFEKAAKLRDRLLAIQGMMDTQRATAPDHAERDVIGLMVVGGNAYVTLFMFRDGKLVNQENFTLKAVDVDSGAELPDGEVLEAFVSQYYERASDLPREVLLPAALSEAGLLQDWIESMANHRLKFLAPQRGKNRDLVNLANENAKHYAKQAQVRWQAGVGQDVEAALEGLKKILKLKKIPRRIECYDISHLGGTDTVGSMVVFEKGFPKKADYRHFKLRSVQEKIDDYQAMKEVLGRRLRYLQTMPEGFRKPKKKELEKIQEILEENKLDAVDLNQHKMLIVERKKKMVGMIRYKDVDKDVYELASLWVDSKHRGKGLGRDLVLWMLKKLKKGKVYAVPAPELRDWAGAMGFHEVKGTPKGLEEKAAWCAEIHSDEAPVFMVHRLSKEKEDGSFSRKPDLLIVDGGKGQLKMAGEAMKEAGLSIPLISLAKKQEEIFVPGKGRSILLPYESDELQLVQRLRDEAHRFALKYQRNLRGKRMLS